MNRIASIAAFIVVFLVGSLFGLGAGKMSSSTTGQEEITLLSHDFALIFHLDKEEITAIPGKDLDKEEVTNENLEAALKYIGQALTEEDVVIYDDHPEMAFATKLNSHCVWYRGYQYYP